MFLAILTLASNALAQPSFPKLFFSYSSLYDDTVCPPERTAVNADWAREAFKKQGDFSRVWEREAPALLGTLLREFNRGMKRQELTATLSVCPDSWNYSNPLVIRAIQFLPSAMGAQGVWPDRALADIVFHELLHTWLVDNFDFSKSALLARYGSETDNVRSHLHLMAVQVLVYSDLKRQDWLDWIAWKYPHMDADYQRAWQIVHGIETPEPFIRELRQQLERGQK